MSDPIADLQKFHPETGEQLILDASSIDVFLQCPTKYKYSVLERWRKKSDELNPARSWGSAVHDALEVYDVARFNNEPHENAQRKAVERLVANEWNLYNPYKPALWDELISRPDYDVNEKDIDNAKTLPTAVRAVVWYTEQYKQDRLLTAPDPEGNPAVEIRFEVHIPDTDYRLSGRLDKLAEQDGKLYIVDRKTTNKTLGTWYFDTYWLSTQVKAYLWAFKKQMGQDIDGFIIDAIQAAVGFNRFERHLITQSNDQLQEFEDNLKRTLERMSKASDEGFYEMNLMSCGNFGGCMFKNICSRTATVRPHYFAEEDGWIQLEPRESNR